MSRDMKTAYDDQESNESIDVIRALHELRNMRNRLSEENERYIQKIKEVSYEMDGLSISISESEDYVASFTEKRETVNDRVDEFKERRNQLIEELNRERFNLKAVTDDLGHSSIMLKTLAGELDDIKNDKDIMLKRLKAVDAGINGICQEKESKLPGIMSHDRVLKKAYRVFKEAENRMDVAIQFRARSEED